ncbi:MAE_28990/MAE_18760 family HEPN-like nuclease [Janthinobacterium sp. SUN098]|uniref:MAE_28990/MAE_18760 family HEPN-like nuclease n=1 Tax=Janthinobacterium sp. SUN098 TaxID=3002437 RepID=UPI0038D42D95
MKIRTLDELSQRLAESISWRKHELQNLSSFFKDNKKPLIPLVKGALLLTYAHWEGGIKDMSQCYLLFVEKQKCLRKDLQPCFLALASIAAIKTAAPSKSLLPYLQAVDYVLNSNEHRYSLPNIQLIDTESNLSTKVFRNILMCVGLDDRWSSFELKQRTIDVALLKVRNEIAHTGRTDRDEIDLADLLHNVMELLETFKTEVENAAAIKRYRLDWNVREILPGTPK